MRRWLCNVGTVEWKASVGLLGLRLSSGMLMAVLHGWGKYQKYETKSASFPDPLNVGPEVSMALTIFAELLCASLVALGLFTRWSAAVGLFTMGVAAFIVHGDDPLRKQELALMYFSIYGALVVLGPGRFSIDHQLVK